MHDDERVMKQQDHPLRRDGGIATLEFGGPVGSGECGEVLLEHLARGEHLPFRGLLIISSARRWNPSTDHIERIAALFAAHGNRFGHRVAIIVSEPLQYGLARILEVFAERRGVACRPFWNDSDARAWLEAAGGRG